jgi:hypothetical protein
MFFIQITPSTTGSVTPLIDNVIAPLAAANAVSFLYTQ